MRSFRKLLFLLRRSDQDRSLAEEIEMHRSLLAESLQEQGLQPDAAQRLMGNITLAKEDSREMWAFRYLDSSWRNLRHACRGFLRTPGFTATAVLSLALGIGANTAIFSFVNAILLKRLPVAEPNRLVTFSESYHGETSGQVWKLSIVEQMAQRDPSLSGLFGRFPKPVSFSAGQSAEWMMAELVTGQYFATLQIKPALGRLLTDQDVQNATAAPVCVLSYSLWQREFGGNPQALNRTITLNGHSYRVLGITERGFYGTDLQHRFDLQIPATRIGDFMPAFGDSTGVSWLQTLSWLSPMARLRPGVSRQEAQQQTQRIFHQVQLEGGDKEDSVRKRELHLEDASQGFSTLRSEFGRPVVVLMGIAALVLLIACANLANLLLSRSQAREREFALRISIGGSRSQLISQLLIENLLLGAVGGLAGIMLSFWITQTLLAFLNAGKSTAAALHVSPDVNVLLFSTVLSVAAALLFGLVPAFASTSPTSYSGLQHSVASGGVFNRLSLRRSLVVLQIALSLVVVFVAGLLTQTLRTLKTVDLGFQPEHVISLNVDPAASGYASADVSRILAEILNRTRALPEVKAASLAASTPNGSFEISLSFEVPGYQIKAEGDDVAAFNFVSSSYFSTMGQTLIRGRDIREADGKNSPRVAIVNQKFAAHYFGARNPIGRKFRQGGGDVEIVGMAHDARDHGARSGPVETVYLPITQTQTSGLTLLIRSRNEPTAVISSLLAIIKNIDSRMPVFSVHTLNADLEAGLSTERILGFLSTLFAALATTLAGIGLYGVVAYSVARRTREVGIRFAVGAQRKSVVTLFVKENLLMLGAGLVIGLPAAIASAQALKNQLFGIQSTDPLTIFLSVLVLGLAAALAMAIPLFRATRMDPVSALRYE